MKILLVNSIFYPQVIGGAEGATLLLARELSAAGLQVDVLTTTGRRAGRADRLRERRLEGIDGRIYEAPSWGLYDLLPAEDSPTPSIIVRGVHHFLGIRSGRWDRLARAAIARSQPDLLHTHTIVGITPSIWRAAAGTRRPIVHTLHDYHLLCPRTTLLRSSGEICERPRWPCRILAAQKLRATQSVDVVTAPSRFVLENHLQAGGFRRARAMVVPNACTERPEVPPDRSELTARQGLFLGQIDTHKGIDGLMAALERLLASSPPPAFRFVFAGAGPRVEAVREFCARNAAWCRYVGVVRGAAKAELLRQSSFLVLPSMWHDNFPLVILEAFNWGLPVIGARRGGIPEVIEDGVNGFVIEPEPEALATAMRRYAVEPSLGLEHGRAALKRSQDFSVERHVASFVTIYEDLIRNRQAKPRS